MEDMDYYEYEESKKRFTPSKIIKFIFKLIAFIIIGGTFAMLFGRMYFMKIPKNFEGVTFTEKTVEAFEKGSLKVELQTVADPYSDKGEYHISNTALVIQDDSQTLKGEVQCTVRYNNRSTVNRLMSMYSLEERPQGELFVYILSDNNGNTYTEYTYAKTEKMIHDFRRIVFSDVDLTDVEYLYLEVFYKEDVRRPAIPEPGKKKEKTMYSKFLIYNKEYSVGFTEVTKAEKTTLTFQNRPEYISKLDK